MESMDGLKDFRAPLRLPDMMRAAGFTDIEHRMLPLHTCGWSDSKQRSLGRCWRSLLMYVDYRRKGPGDRYCNERERPALPVVYGYLSVQYVGPVCAQVADTDIECVAERLGMTPTDVQFLIANARNEADHPAFKVSRIICLSTMIANLLTRRISHCKVCKLALVYMFTLPVLSKIRSSCYNGSAISC
jgi:hypothetical protein